MSLMIRPIEAADNSAIAAVIAQVGLEFGTVGEGFGPGDAEVTCMSEHYQESGYKYFIAEWQGEIVGGGGVAPFDPASQCCELRKLFLLPKARQQGIGKALTLQCLAYAEAQGYLSCYLDTVSTMIAAICLYQDLGFKQLSKPHQATIHSACDVWMLKDFNRGNDDRD